MLRFFRRQMPSLACLQPLMRLLPTQMYVLHASQATK